jgi:hypothetical protein
LPILIGCCKALYRTHILAVSATMICVFQATAATAAGAIHDATGQYVLAFVAAMILCGFAIVGVFLVREDANAGESEDAVQTVPTRD